MDPWPARQGDTVDDVLLGAGPRYPSVPVRPLLQLVARAGLWLAIGVGFVGGIIGLVRPPGGAASTPPGDPVAPAGVPAPVAGTAEVAVAAWLTATSADGDRLAELFVSPPSVAPSVTESMFVERATTIGGQPLGPGYWSVTVAVDLIEVPSPVGDTAADEPAVEEPAPAVVTWYVAVGVVGDPATGLAAVNTPAVLAGPPPPPAGWSIEGPAPQMPDPADALVVMADGFLSALLTGSGDASRYMAPGVDPPRSLGAPFASIAIDEIAVSPLEDPAVAVQVWLTARTPGGTALPVFYEIVAAEGDGRWEVMTLSGTPTVRVPPPDVASPGGSPPPAAGA